MTSVILDSAELSPGRLTVWFGLSATGRPGPGEPTSPIPVRVGEDWEQRFWDAFNRQKEDLVNPPPEPLMLELTDVSDEQLLGEVRRRELVIEPIVRRS